MPIVVFLYRCFAHGWVIISESFLKVSKHNLPDITRVLYFHHLLWWYFSDRLHSGFFAYRVQVSTRIALAPLHDLIVVTIAQTAVDLFHQSFYKP